ncbi:GNAT family N-acetyltransferase [Paraburkholderia susongensis]|uniref:GNAT family N-acetyltransferase n=1 Tax=Paraburkholderia susongensis TaxID=1515439 RepID=UPI000A1CBDBA|nr:GNAT family N-acetyltransferase [Paraburkholderia susongensis]
MLQGKRPREAVTSSFPKVVAAAATQPGHDTSDTIASLRLVCGSRDPEVTRFVAGPWSDRQKHRAFVESRTLASYPAGMGYWTIRFRSNPTDFLGWILLIPTDAVGPEIEIGWRLPRNAWGYSIATEAGRPVLQHAFATLEVAEVVAEIDARNFGSISTRATRPPSGRKFVNADDSRVHRPTAPQ